ncbi:hypothetical protein SmJEL517_g00282 [Synchytrium microbalum]|uniref:Uncharacterized protein n=1 Tax=Synchytrium microbalum TaxID=1806994 RepID=A0A507CGE2_9FUNG|nr:uncharacterized protein SmJEL517_g00282 [Synchytrium microbalum]TPX38279.1 hypothetical protein SmJEL517_g00282 [Synchytrium microbalum]
MSQRTLRVVVLPTLNQKTVFHARFLQPANPFERGAIVAAYVLRKWRYSLSDTLAYYWHSFGATSEPKTLSSAIYRAGNYMTTRRSADEYFLKMIPMATERIQFMYPTSSNLALVKKNLNLWLQNSDRHTTTLFLWTLIFPVDFYVSKFFVVGANLLFIYNCFRVVSSFRAVMGARQLKKLVEENGVEFVASDELQKSIEESANESGVQVVKDGDIDDAVVDGVEKRLKCVELGRTYRRTRFQYFVHGGKD